MVRPASSVEEIGKVQRSRTIVWRSGAVLNFEIRAEKSTDVACLTRQGQDTGAVQQEETGIFQIRRMGGE